MAGSLEPAMATTSHSLFQWALMSMASMVATVLLLLLCGFCRRLRKQGTLSLHERNGSLNRAPTTLTKITHKNEKSAVNGTKTVEGIENGAFSASEPVEQSKTPVEMNGFVVGTEEVASRPGDLQASHSRSASQNKTLQQPQESFKHRRLPSIPHTMQDQPTSDRNSGVLLRRPTVQPPEPPTYEEVHVGKAAVEAPPPEVAVGGGLAERTGPMHESWIDDEEEWPAPPLTLFDQPLENVYTDLKKESMGALEDQPVIVPTVSAGTQESSPQATALVGEGANDGNSPSTPSWRFHLSLTPDTKDSTTAQDPVLNGLYSKVKKSANRHVSFPLSTLENPIEVEDDVPPPVPIKHFNVEEDLSTQNQDIEEQLPPPPSLELN